MPNLLSVLASPRGDYSISRALTARFVEEWQKNHHGTVVTRDLYASEIPFVDAPWIGGAYTPAEQHSPEMAKSIGISDKLVDELVAADTIVIAAPMYNFSTPAILKAWIDQVVRLGRTFTAKYEGLLTGKKTIVIVASMGDYSPGAYMEAYNKETAYLQHILGFMGLTDVKFIMAGGTSAVDQGQTSREAYLAQHTPEVLAAAS